MKLSQKQQTAGVHVMVFGPPKVGKSQLAGEMAKHGYKLLWIDLENGWEVLQKLPPEVQDNIEIVALPDTRTYPIGIQTMLKIVTGAKHVICDEHGTTNCPLCKKNTEATYTTVELNTLDPAEWIVVIDTTTQLATSAMAHITKSQSDDYKPDWDDFMKQGVLMDKFFSSVQQARWNCICIAHEIEVEMEDGKKRLVPIGGTTNFSRNVAKYFGHVIRAEVKNKKHTFGSATTFSIAALTGSRTDVAIEGMGEPSLLPFFRKGSNSGGGGTSEATSVSAGPTEVATSESGSSSLTALERYKQQQAAKKASGG